MPTLRDILAALPIPAEDLQRCELEIRKRWPGERVYISPADSRKDPSRTEAIRQSAKRLPVGVVAQKFGVSRQWVYRVTKK